jgi:hypothetical protein
MKRTLPTISLHHYRTTLEQMYPIMQVLVDLQALPEDQHIPYVQRTAHRLVGLFNLHLKRCEKIEIIHLNMVDYKSYRDRDVVLTPTYIELQNFLVAVLSRKEHCFSDYRSYMVEAVREKVL